MIYDLFLVIIFGGIMNGSFALPLRFIKNTVVEKKWLYFSIIGIVFCSWFLLIVTRPQDFSQYTTLPSSSILVMVIGGLIYGIGQACVAFAIDIVGIALAFAINLGVSVVVGSLCALIINDQLLSKSAIQIYICLIFIIVSLIAYYFSKERSHSNALFKGCALATFAGIGSGIQNASYILVCFHSNQPVVTANTYWFFPMFFTIAALSMFSCFYLKLRNNPENKNQLQLDSPKDILYIIVMGLLYAGSLVTYSYSMSHFDQSDKAIGWPLFMISIILGSQFWGITLKEDHAIKPKLKGFSVCLLILAIVVLSL